MARAEERAARKLEKQIAKAQARLTDEQGKKKRRGGLFGGLFLGTVAGGLLTYYLIQRRQDDEWEQETGEESIVLREQPQPTGQTAKVAPLPKLDVEKKSEEPDAAAATTLESAAAPEEIEEQQEADTRPAAFASTPQAEEQEPQESVAPATPSAPASTQQDAPAPEQEAPAKEQQAQSGQDAPAKEQDAPAPQQAESQQDSAATEAEAPTQGSADAPLPVETERPEIVLAKASGNSDETLAEATSDEPTPAPDEARAEPVDGVCPASHPIKGNRGSMGAMIYHVPGGRNYDRTKPEACFATTDDAEKAGYRAPRG